MGLRSAAALALITAALLAPAATSAVPGTPLWDARIAPNPGSNFPAGAALEGRVLVVGMTLENATDTDWQLEARDVRDGSLLWTEVFDSGGPDLMRGVTSKGRRVCAAGVSVPAPPATATSTWRIRCHDLRSGALLWEFDGTGTHEGSVAAATFQGRRLIVAGSRASLPYVRVVNGRDGTVLWERASSIAPGQVREVLARGRRLFVGMQLDGSLALQVGALGLRSGDELWNRPLIGTGTVIRFGDLAYRGGRIIAAGMTDGVGALVAWSARDGTRVWPEPGPGPSGSPGDDGSASLVVRGSILYALLASERGGTRFDAILSADARTGSPLESELLADFSPVAGVAQGGKQILVVGASASADMMVRAYDRRSLATLWEASVHDADDTGLLLVASRKEVVALGISSGGGGDFAVLIEAWSAR
jgi:outer membrane protein assembly factor BamB